jgi:hypothetical protein
MFIHWAGPGLLSVELHSYANLIGFDVLCRLLVHGEEDGPGHSMEMPRFVLHCMVILLYLLVYYLLLNSRRLVDMSTHRPGV